MIVIIWVILPSLKIGIFRVSVNISFSFKIMLPSERRISPELKTCSYSLRTSSGKNGNASNTFRLTIFLSSPKSPSQWPNAAFERIILNSLLTTCSGSFKELIVVRYCSSDSIRSLVLSNTFCSNSLFNVFKSS